MATDDTGDVQATDWTRRDVLASAGRGMAAAAVGTVAASTFAQQPGKPVSQTVIAQEQGPTVPTKDAPKRVGFAVVGLGKFTVGQVLPQSESAERCQITGLVSGDATKARAIADKYRVQHSHIYHYDDYDSMKDNDDIQVVYIVLPNALHAEYTVRALEAGKHVLCEKPMATSVADCQRMIDAARQAGKKLMIAYRVHYEPHNQKVIAWRKEQKYGPLQFANFNALMDVGGANQWRLDPKLSGGGSLWDIGIYAVNGLCYLVGEEPAEISAFHYRDPREERFKNVFEQNIGWQFRFPSGVIGTGTSSYSSTSLNRCHVACANGWWALDPATSYYGQRLFHSGDDPKTQAYEQVIMKHIPQVAAEMDHLAYCITHDEPVTTPGEMGLRDVRLMTQIYQAAQSGQIVQTHG